MPLYKFCSRCSKNRIPKGQAYCDRCQSIIDANNKKKYREYNHKRYEENKDYVKFYNSIEWIRLKETIKGKQFGICLPCIYRAIVLGISPIYKGEDTCCSDYVHHIVEVSEDFSRRLDEDNLICVCSSCHKEIHDLYNKSEDDKIKMQNELRMIVEWFEKFFGLCKR